MASVTDKREQVLPARVVECARHATRYFVSERNARGLGGPEPFLARRARKVVSVANIPAYQPSRDADFDTWSRRVLLPNALQLIERLLDAGDVRQLAPLAMPASPIEADHGPHPLIPPKKYWVIERIMNEGLGVSLTITMEPGANTFTLWVGYA